MSAGEDAFGNGTLDFQYNDGDNEASAEDVFDQILENYNFICHPEIRLKLKHEWVKG